MVLDRVTLTGADDSVQVSDLVQLSKEFPFVEWGILVHQGTNRMPHTDWAPRWPSERFIIQLQQTISRDFQMNLSLHVCGHWVRELLLGRNHVPPMYWLGFQRAQLNFHAENTPCDKAAFLRALTNIADGGLSFIFQIDGNGGNEHLESLWDEIDRVNSNLDTVALFDVSGGAGVVPAEWPRPQFMNNDQDYAYHGYAGGLGPDNVVAELKRIEAVAGDCRIWIDMETRVRSECDSKFDLDKCRSVLEQCKPFVSQPSPVVR